MTAQPFWIPKPEPGPRKCKRWDCRRAAVDGDYCLRCEEDNEQMRYLQKWHERKEVRDLHRHLWWQEFWRRIRRPLMIALMLFGLFWLAWIAGYVLFGYLFWAGAL